MSTGVTSILELLKLTADQIRTMGTPDRTLGEPFERDGVTVVPVFKASFGFAGGGAVPEKEGKLAGGAGARAELTPQSFLVIRDGQVTVVSAETAPVTKDGAGALVSSLAGQVTKLFQKQKKEKQKNKD